MQAFFKIAGSEQAGLSPDGMGVNGMAGTVTRKESENMAARQNISNQCQSGIRFMIFGLTTFVTYVTFRNMTGKELMKELNKSGWKLDRTHGSHYIMKKDGCKPISIPVHAGKDIPPGTLNKLFKDTGLKGE